MSKDNVISETTGDILLVGDEQNIIKLKSKFTKNSGYHIRIAADYEEARRCLSDKLPDLILQDINSTDMSGIEFCRQIKADSDTENIPIIAVIDDNNGKLKVAALEAGANDYVAKPIELSEITTRINTHLKMLSLQQKIDTQAEELISEKLACKKSKKKAKKAQILANQYINISEIILLSIDPLGNVQSINTNGCKILGYNKDEIIGKNWVDNFLPKHLREEIKHISKQVLSGSVKFSKYHENSIITKSGEEKFIAWHNSVLTDETGEIIGTLSSGEDISERKLAREALLESEEKFRVLYNNSPDMYVSVSSEDATILLCNETLLQKTGYLRDEIIGSPIFKMYHDDCIDQAQNAFQLFAETGIVEDKELLLKRKDGSKIEVSLNVNSVKDKSGNILYSISSWRDISAVKKFEKEKIDSENRFEQLVNTIKSGVAIYKVINDGKFGKDYIIRDFNRKSLELEGLKKEDVVGKSLFDLRPKIDEYGLIDTFRQVWKTGEPAFFPTKIYVDDKYSNYYENHVYRMPNGEIAAVYDDVTEQITAINMIKESRERFDLAMKATNDGLFDRDLVTNEIFYSPSWKTMLGYSDDELPNDFSVWEKLTNQDDVKKTLAMLDDIINMKRDSFEIEFKMQHKAGHWVDILSRANVIFDETGKAVRVVGSHIDISLRKKIENSLKQSEKNLAEAQKISNVGSWDWNFANDEFSVSDEWMRIHGVSKSKLSRNEMKPIAHQDDAEEITARFNQALSGSKPYEITHRIIQQDTGNERTVYAKAQILRDSDGNPVRMIGIAQDITERKLAEQALLEEKLKLVEAQEIALLGRWDLNLINNHLQWSDGIFRLFEIDPGKFEVSYKAFLEAVHPDDREKVDLTYNESLKNKLPYEITHRLLMKDGRIKWVREKCRTEYDLQGSAVRSIGIIQDITKQKTSEQELQESNDKYINLMDSLGTGVVLHAPDTSVILSNPKASEILGISTEQMQGRKAIDPRWKFVRSDGTDLPLEEYPVNRALRLMKPFSEYFVGIKRPDRKNITWVNVNGSLVFDENNYIKYITISFIDSTEIKLAESEIRYQASLIEQVESAIITIGLDNKILSWNEHAKNLYGWNKEEVIGKDIIELLGTEELEEETLNNFADLNRDGHWEGDYLAKRKDGTRIPIHVVNTYLKNPFGENIGFIGVSTDITETQQAESRLRDSERRNRNWIENSPICTKIVDLDYNLQFMSESGVRGLKIDNITEFYGKPYPLHFYPDSFNIPMTKNLKRAKETGETIIQEAPIVDIKGNTLWYHSTIVPVNDDEGQLEYFLVVSLDITEQKEAEQALKGSEEFSKELIEFMADGFSILDENGVHLDVNRAFCEMTGFAKEELIGIGPPHPYWPEEEYKNIQEAFTRTSAGNFENFELVFKKKNGKRFPVIVSPSQTKDDKGNVTSSFAVVMDITKRKLAEEELSKERTLLKTVIDNIPVLLTRYNPDSNLLYLNNEFEKILGWKNEELEDINLIEKVYPDPDYRKQAIEYMQNAGSEWREFQVTAKSGKTVSSEWSNIRLDDGTQIGIGIDISDRKKAARALLESEKKFKTLVTNSEEIIFMLDKDGIFTLSEGKGLAKLGVKPGQVVGGSIYELYKNYPEMLGDVRKALTGQTVSNEREVEEHHFRSWYTPQFNQAGKTIGIFGLSVNITEQKLAEAEITRLNEDLESKLNDQTKELKDKIAHLERFYNATIDREIRMKELRNEIEELKKKLEEK